MYFLFILFIIVSIYILFIKKTWNENFEFKEHNKINDPMIDNLVVYEPSKFTNDDKDKLMRTFGTDIFSVYKLLKSDIMKTQLWSYCIIYKNGGIYSENEFTNDISIFDRDGLVVLIKNNLFYNSLFASPKPNNPILKVIIELCVKRIVDNEIIDDEQIDYITGSKCFTDGILQYLSENDNPIYKNLNDYIKYKSKILTVLETTSRL
jgi:hypothetical protein